MKTPKSNPANRGIHGKDRAKPTTKKTDSAEIHPVVTLSSSLDAEFSKAEIIHLKRELLVAYARIKTMKQTGDRLVPAASWAGFFDEVAAWRKVSRSKK